MKTETLFSSQSDEWETPNDIYDSLDAEFHFNLDPCSTRDNHKAPFFYTKQEDGLNQNWGGVLSFLQSSI